MKLISSKKAKRRIALMFVFAFMLSNLLSLFGPSAKAVVTLPTLTAGTCFQHTGSAAVASGGLVTVYSIGTIQLSLLASDLSPGQDTAALAAANSAVAQATSTTGTITAANDVQGNVFSLVPPAGTNFVIVPGFADTGANRSNILATVNATISGAQSQDATGGANSSDLAIEVGIPTQGTAGIGRVLVAIARDSDTTGIATIGAETYPKSGTNTNTATISINGLGIAIPPSADGALSGTLQATFDATPPSGIGTYTTGNNSTATVAAAIPSLSGTLNICTVTSPAGQLEAIIDTDSTTDLYDKQSTASPNLLALSQIGTLTRVHILDTTTGTASFTIKGNAGAALDLEPLIIRGTAGTGTATRDQVFATGNLATAVDAADEVPSAAVVASTVFGNNSVAPITVVFSTDNTSAMTVLDSVDIILDHSTAGSTPTTLGYNTAQNSRQGVLGALRAVVRDAGNTTTNGNFKTATNVWGVASLSGGPGQIAIQEAAEAASSANTLGGLATLVGNSTEPFNNTFIDLRLECGSSTNPVGGWFAIINSEGGLGFGTTVASNQVIAASQAGGKILTNSLTNFYRQSLTNIAGTAPTISFVAAGGNTAAMSSSNIADNAILYASCVNSGGNGGVVTIIPIQNGFDGQRDTIAISPYLTTTNVSSTFTSDINFFAQISGNNLSGTTTLNLTKLVGTPPTGNSTLVSSQGVALSTNGELGVTCSSGGTGTVQLSSVTSGTLATAVSAACTGGAIAPAPAFFTGGAPDTVSGTTIIDGSPTVQGNARGILLSETTGNATGFSELVNQVGGGTQGTAFEISFAAGCDVIDDLDDNNTASSSSSAAGSLGGNDVSRTSVTATAGVSAAVTAGGTGNAALTNINVLQAASGSTPAKAFFRLATAPGTGTDALTTDAVLFRIEAQDLFCPTSVMGTLTASVRAVNNVSAPTTTSPLGTANLGTALQAITFAVADDVATSTKLETSTNTMLGATPRLVGGAVTTANPFSLTENDPTSIPIGGTVSSRNVNPEFSSLSNVLTRGQIWLIPAAGTAFTTAPAVADVSFSDDSLIVDGTPVIVTGTSVDSNAPIGSLLIGVKDNTATTAVAPATVATTITVKNLKFASATSSTTDLVASALFFSQDSGVIINTPGAAAGNNASSPTVFTPYVQGTTKALNQLEAAGVQLGTGGLANQLLTSRLTTQGAPQLNPFAKVVTSAKNADGTKITVTSSKATTPEGTTENVITVTGAAGAVDGSSRVVVSTGSTTFDSVTVVASDDGSFTAKVRGDCATATSVTVNVAEEVSGTKTTSVTKTALCSGETEVSEDSIFTEIAGSDGIVAISEVLSYVSANGGLAAIVSAGGGKLAGVIKAAKAALGLS